MGELPWASPTGLLIMFFLSGLATASKQDAEKVCQPILFIWFVWFVSFVWLNETDQMNQINQMNQTNHKRQRAFLTILQAVPLPFMTATSLVSTALQRLFNSLRALSKVFTSSLSLRPTVQIQSTSRHLMAMSGQRAWSCR
jgi:hypothetical protein